MTNLILKFFVGTNIDYRSKQTRNKIGIVTNIIGISSNILLFIIKFIIGLLSNSISIMSDSINNLNDSISSIVALLGFKFSDKTADKEHPFGHGRAEYISAFVISFIIMWFGLEFLRISFKKILNPEPIFLNTSMLLFLLFTICVKVWLGIFNYKVGKKINSNTILATSRDSFSDVLVTSTTIISSVITIYTGYIIDGYAGIFVSVLIFYSGYQIAKEALSTLIGEAVPSEVVEQITNIIKKHENIIGIHDLIIHNYGTGNYIATIHIEVNSKLSFHEAHNIVDEIEREIFSSLNIHLTTHIDPVDVDNKELIRLKPIIEQYVTSIDNVFIMNDLRIIESDCSNKILFEICIPIGYTEKNINMIKVNSEKFIETLYPNYECIVSIQKSFLTI